MKSIYFVDKKGVHRFLSLGQIAIIIQACYFKAKELGYDRVILEWHDKITYPNWDNDGRFKGLLHKPPKSILPIHYTFKGDNVAKSIDIFDISESGELYDDSPPIISNPMNLRHMLNYLNKYYEETNEHPVFNIEKETNTPYILFHYRISEQDRQIVRNTNLDDFKRILKLCKDRGIECHKIGEVSPIDDQFDIVYDYFPNNIESLFRIINDCSIFVGTTSGPSQIAYMLNVPSIMSIDKPTQIDYITNKWVGDGKNVYGKTGYDWIDKERYYFVWNDLIDIYDVDMGGFIDKWISI